MNKAVFSIEHYQFKKVNIDTANFISKDDIEIGFDPSGIFNSSNQTYELTFSFTASNSNTQPFVYIQCVGLFKFENVSTIDDIPVYFYKNSIAILFPFLRAFVSMVTIQANVHPIMLPTMNLSALEEPLKLNTTQTN